MQRSDPNIDKKFLYFLGAITLVGFFLRLQGLGTESITGDEASALLQLKFPSFHAMIEGGVRSDVHPAFTEVFLWFWTKWFGNEEFILRLPFAIFGTASIWLSGIIASKWFSNSAGLATAIGIAFLQFPLMYSQLARPYAPGLFFTLLSVYFWTQLVQGKSKRKRDFIGFAFAAALAAYSHYFSLLTTTLIAIAGIFFVAKEMRLRYFLSCALAVLLFLPHLSITLSQLKKGGAGGPDGWVQKPTTSFFLDHLKFAFDDSSFLMWGVFGICFLSFVIFFKRPNKFQLLSILFWVMPLAIGYIYSVAKNPVLQHSCLLFSFPFLLMFLFSRIPDFNLKKIGIVFPVVFAFVFFSFITFYKPYHLTDHFGRLKELVAIAVDLQEKHSTDGKKVDVYYNVDVPFYLEYNCQRLGKSPQHVLGTNISDANDLVEIRNLVENSTADYFVYGWSTRYSPWEILPIIQERFPYLIRREEWFNSAVYVFSNREDKNYIRETGRMFESYKFFDIEGNNSEYKYDSSGKQFQASEWSKTCNIEVIDSSLLNMVSDIVDGHFVPHVNLSPNYDIRLDSSCVYSPSLTMKVGDILKNPDNEILFTAQMQLLDSTSKIVLVMEFQRDGKQLHWNGMASTTQIDSMNWNHLQNIYFGLQLPIDIRKTDTVKFYCYSLNGHPALINSLDVKTLKGHRNIYGPRPDYE